VEEVVVDRPTTKTSDEVGIAFAKALRPRCVDEDRCADADPHVDIVENTLLVLQRP